MEEKLCDAPNMENPVEILKREYPTIYKAFTDIQQEQLVLFAKKHLDYGMGNVSAGTNLDTPEEVEFALTGLWYRISDKINRWKNMILTKRGPNNESLSDTFQDIANYGIISQMVQRGLWRR